MQNILARVLGILRVARVDAVGGKCSCKNIIFRPIKKRLLEAQKKNVQFW